MRWDKKIGMFEAFKIFAMEGYQLAYSIIIYDSQKSILIESANSVSFGISIMFQIMKKVNSKSLSKIEVDKCGTSVLQLKGTRSTISRWMRNCRMEAWVH